MFWSNSSNSSWYNNAISGKNKNKPEVKGHSPVAVSHHIPAQPLGQVRSDPVQFLWSRHGVEGQLLHVGFTEAILKKTHKHESQGLKEVC